MKRSLLLLFISACIIIGCGRTEKTPTEEVQPDPEKEIPNKLPVIFDTDANNELDDQHALAYLLFNGNTFDVRGITVNATYNGGEIGEHFAEAERVMKLCDVGGKIPIYSGANGDFEEIRGTTDQAEYDGKIAVNFIIKEARKVEGQKLVLLPVGKLTNIALALQVAPDIKEKVRIVWLGSNYPKPGEYNQENDLPSLSYILEQEVPFEMVMVRYEEESGSSAVHVTPALMEEKMPGTGPIVAAVEGRHGDSFTNFGDYSVDLFRNAEMYGDPPSRSLFDMVAVAILKNPSWGEAPVIPAPRLNGENWEEQPDNSRKITIWENFDRDAILDDFFAVMQDPIIAKRE